ncbi:hypothetical protein BDW69DRAFT_189030 [Aspergillus filifer]
MEFTTAVSSALLAALTLSLGASAKEIGTLTLGYRNQTVVQIPVVDQPWCNNITDDIAQVVLLEAYYDSTDYHEIECHLYDYVPSLLHAQWDLPL